MHISKTKEEVVNTPLVLVVWEDITSENPGWFSLEVIPSLEVSYCYSPGWIVAVTDSHLTLVQDVATHKEDLTPSVDLVIPMGCIKKIIKLRTKWQYQQKTLKSQKTLTASDLKIYLPYQDEDDHSEARMLPPFYERDW